MHGLLPSNLFTVLFFLHGMLLLAAVVQICRCRETLFHKLLLLVIALLVPVAGSLLVLTTAPRRHS
ncbi:MAG: hypothetical protein ACK4E8_06100 [Lacibacter sp.]